MTKKRKKTARQVVDPSEMRSWDNDDHRMLGREAFLRNVEPPSAERQKCIDCGVYARTKFAEWGQFYIEGELPPANFPPFDPNGKLTPIPTTTVFRVYEDHKDRPKRDERVVFILDVAGVVPEHRDKVWRCTYTPYMSRKERLASRRKLKSARL